MTTAERVAILDRQLEQSTGVFDAILRDERDQQRETQRAQGATQPTQTTAETSSGRNPYETADSDGYGSSAAALAVAAEAHHQHLLSMKRPTISQKAMTMTS